ncbi:hypothetical protein HPP92_006283, partial [Vanilla planifolia]
LAELRGARANGIKNIDSISSLEPESKKRLKEVELPGYDVSVSFEGPKTLSVLKRKRGAGPQNGAMLVASNNRKEENEVNLHSRKDAHKGKHSRRDAHKGNFEIYDWIGVDLPKVETCAKEEALNHADTPPAHVHRNSKYSRAPMVVFNLLQRRAYADAEKS